MSTSGGLGIIIALACVTSCGGVAALPPTGPSPAGAPASAPEPPAAPAPPAAARTRVIGGSVGPAVEGSGPCFADRYPCEVFDFVLEREGPIEVTLTWDGAGEGLAHEDVAPRNGPSRISFVRPRMEAARYTVRVVSLEPARAISFTLALTY